MSEILSNLDKEYTKLRYLLAAKDWLKADDETATLIAKISGKDEYDIILNKSLNEDEISKIPCKNLQIIDKLWMNYSNNKFGFTIQVRKYLHLQENPNLSRLKKRKYEIFMSLSKQLGWRGIRYDTWANCTKHLGFKKLPEGFFPRCSLAILPDHDFWKIAFFMGNLVVYQYKDKRLFGKSLLNFYNDNFSKFLANSNSTHIISLFFSRLEACIIPRPSNHNDRIIQNPSNKASLETLETEGNKIIIQTSKQLDEKIFLLNNENYYTPENNEIAQKQILKSIAQRRGQPKFREGLQGAYDYCCAITDCDAEQALEAAHIIPYCQTEDNDISNGLLLRADIHTLFDLNLIAIEPETYKVHLALSLRYSSYFDDIKDKYLKLPNNESYRPKKEALEWRWKFFDCNS